MKTAKKLLCTVLVLVMAIGLIPFSASAEFTDADKISYNEAVDLLVALKILEGKPGNMFDPLGGLTRAEASAYITRTLLGRAKADKLPDVASKFSDVPANHWASKYIAYCDSMGIIVGIGDNKFGPDDPVRGSHFAVMLMRALGIQPATPDRWMGSTWEMFAVLDGIENGLFEGTDLDYTANATREEAARYTFNALKWSKTKVSKVKTSYYLEAGPAWNSTFASQTSLFDLINDHVAYDTYDKAVQAASKNVGALLNVHYKVYEYSEQYDADVNTIGELVHNVIKVPTIADAFGRPSSAWVYADDTSNALVTIKGTIVKEYHNVVAASKIYSDLGLSGGEKSTGYYVDGAFSASTITYDGKNTFGALGSLTEVYKTGSSSYRVVTVNTYIGKVTEKKAATPAAAAYIEISQVVSGGTTITWADDGQIDPDKFVKKFETTDFAKDNFVLYTAALNSDGKYSIKSAVLAEPIKVVPTYVTSASGGSFSVGSTNYNYNATCKQTGRVGATDVSGKKEVTVYVDFYGNAIMVADGSQIPDTYAVLLYMKKTDANTWTGTAASYVARLLLPDATLKDFAVSETTYNTIVTAMGSLTESTLIGRIVKYVEGTTTALEIKGDNGGALSLVRNVPTVTGSIIANSNTVFLVDIDSTTGVSYKSYKGISAIPATLKSTTPAKTWIWAENDIAKYVFIADADANLGAAKTELMYVVAGSQAVNTDTEVGTYYTYTYILNGTINDELKFKNAYDVPGVGDQFWNVVNRDGALVTGGTPVTLAAGSILKGTATLNAKADATGSVVHLKVTDGTYNSEYYSYTDATKVFLIKDGDASGIGFDDIKAGTYVIYIFLTEGKTLDTVFLVA